jgi:opacity protein-like surface antigen
MKKLLAVFALLAVSGVPALAQERGGETPLFEVNAGYTFMHWQVPPALGTPPNYYNYNGFNAGAAYNITHWFAAVADISGVYNSQPNTGSGPTNSHIYSYLFGPRVYPLGHHKLTPFVHALFGVSTFRLNIPAFGGNPALPPETDNAFSFAVGAGLDWKVTKHIAIRLAQLDYQETRLLHTLAADSQVSPDNQNNFKYSGGVVIRFGEK